MNWQEIIIKIITMVLGALLSYAVARLSSMINSKIKDEKLQSCLQTSLQIVTGAVKKTYQTYVDGIKRSDVQLDQLALTHDSTIKLRISAPETAKHRGGLTIYGRSFGNYDQDIRVRMHYKEQAAE